MAANRPIWAQRFDGTNDNLFEFQDRIVASIVGSLEPRVRAVEVARVRGRPTESLDAYDCVLKALSHLYQFTDGGLSRIRRVARSGDRARPLLRAGTCLSRPGGSISGSAKAARWIRRRTRRARSMPRAARSSLTRRTPFALTVAGHVLSFMGENRRSDRAVQQCAGAQRELGVRLGDERAHLAYLGRADEAVERLRNVWRLSPFDPLNFYFWIVAGIAEFVAGRYA